MSDVGRGRRAARQGLGGVERGKGQAAGHHWDMRQPRGHHHGRDHGVTEAAGKEGKNKKRNLGRSLWHFGNFRRRFYDLKS